MREINLSAGAMPGKVIPLYYQGEKNATCIRIDLSDYVALFGGDGEAQLLYQRPGDEAPYAVTLTREGDVVSWKVIKRDVARPGRGWLQLVYTAGETEALSPKLATYAAPSLGQETDPPEEERPWYDEALQAAKDAEEAADRAEDAADRAEAAAEGGVGGTSNLLWRPTVSDDGEISWAQSASDTPPETVNIMGPQGPAGADGAQGEQGPPGPQGPKGDTGDTGPQGATGETGPQGPAGPQGEKGDTGDTGPQGEQGPKGDKGDTGDAGPQGPQGPAGADGATGPAGQDGGYYTPSVTQPSDTTMQVAFLSSLDGMPSVDPVTVELPVREQGSNAWELLNAITLEETVTHVVMPVTDCSEYLVLISIDNDDAGNANNRQVMVSLNNLNNQRALTANGVIATSGGRSAVVRLEKLPGNIGVGYAFSNSNGKYIFSGGLINAQNVLISSLVWPDAVSSIRISDLNFTGTYFLGAGSEIRIYAR